MPNNPLTAFFPLSGRTLTLSDGTTIEAITIQQLMSIATSIPDTLEPWCQNSFNQTLPDVGFSIQRGNNRLFRLGLESFMTLNFDENISPDETLSPSLPGAYVTNQSDGWSAIRLIGPLNNKILELLVQIDIHDSAFPVGSIARTLMEHLNVILIHEAPNQMLLLSASSSAESFWHAIQTAAESAQETHLR